MAVGLYIHVPFCRSKCPYCDFYSICLSENQEASYIDAIIRNFKRYNGTEIDSIYFGGGTPSILSENSFNRIFEGINESFVLKNPEVTIEANPCTVDYYKLAFLRKAGFNRISFGVQSFKDDELKGLGRLHSGKQAIEAVLEAKRAGFENISVDLMLGILKQTRESLSYTVNVLSELPLKHISAYILKIEDNTPYNSDYVVNNIPNEDAVADLYIQAVDELYLKDFIQYEISNFSKKGFECKHNMKYWNCDEYIGIGPSAHSYFNNKRYAVPKSIESFINSELQEEIINEETPGTFEETAMLNLRLANGLSRQVCESFSVDFNQISKKALPLNKAGLVDVSDDRICITKKGFLVSNSIIARLI